MDSLKFVLRLNAASCVCFGLLFLAAPDAVAHFLGDIPPFAMIVLGIGLLGNGAHLIAASRRTAPLEKEVIWFSLGDFSWWLATLGLIATNVWITTAWGFIAAVSVATFVAGLGVAQLWIWGRQSHGHGNKDHLKAIAQSWMALPLWVKIWLFILNAVFLAAFATLPDGVANVSFIAYVATIPLMVGQIGYDAGLRRILGLAHLVPWLPLLVWLIVAADTTPHTSMLTAVLAICLAFDVIDLWRFVKGERAKMGEPLSQSVEGDAINEDRY